MGGGGSGAAVPPSRTSGRFPPMRSGVVSNPVIPHHTPALHFVLTPLLHKPVMMGSPRFLQPSILTCTAQDRQLNCTHSSEGTQFLLSVNCAPVSET